MKIYSTQHRAIVEAPIMKEPETNKYGLEYLHDRDAYEEWLTTHIPVLPEHQHLFKDGQEVEKDIDYYIIENRASYPWKAFAIPIKQQVSEEGGGYYFKLFKFFSDQHDLTLLDSEIQDIIHAVNDFQREEDKEPLPQQEGERLYYDGLTKNYGKAQPYHYTGPKCVSGCKNFPHYETKHHPDCPFYEHSLSKVYDEKESQLSEALAKIKSQEAEIADLRKQLK